jgi:O-antigen/teichoic acid export membrane protein
LAVIDKEPEKGAVITIKTVKTTHNRKKLTSEDRPLLDLLSIGLISLVGIIASFAFQVVTARSLGPSDFGLFAAFLAIVNIASIGSGALQNSVAVQTAKAIKSSNLRARSRKIDPSIFESVAFGAVLVVVVSAFSAQIGQSLDVSWGVILVAALSIPLSFIWARNAGVIQGHGLAQKTINLSTLHALIRIILGFIAFFFTLGLAGFISATMLSTLLITGLAAILLKKLPTRSNHTPFDRATVAVILASMSFAWLTNIDVVFVRALAEPELSGQYAVVALMVKTGFLTPSLLSLYFLPRFVSPDSEKSKTRTLMVLSGMSVILHSAFILIAGPQLITAIFGEQYNASSSLLTLMTISTCPWVFAQALLITTNAQAKFLAPVLLLVTVFVQAISFVVLLPNIPAALIVNGALGVMLVIGLLFTTSKNKNPKD